MQFPKSLLAPICQQSTPAPFYNVQNMPENKKTPPAHLFHMKVGRMKTVISIMNRGNE